MVPYCTLTPANSKSRIPVASSLAKSTRKEAASLYVFSSLKKKLSRSTNSGVNSDQKRYPASSNVSDNGFGNLKSIIDYSDQENKYLKDIVYLQDKLLKDTELKAKLYTELTSKDMEIKRLKDELRDANM